MAPIIAGGLATATNLAADPNTDASSIHTAVVNAAPTTGAQFLKSLLVILHRHDMFALGTHLLPLLRRHRWPIVRTAIIHDDPCGRYAHDCKQPRLTRLRPRSRRVRAALAADVNALVAVRLFEFLRSAPGEGNSQPILVTLSDGCRMCPTRRIILPAR